MNTVLKVSNNFIYRYKFFYFLFDMPEPCMGLVIDEVIILFYCGSNSANQIVEIAWKGSVVIDFQG
jgi:hypothetical protein